MRPRAAEPAPPSRPRRPRPCRLLFLASVAWAWSLPLGAQQAGPAPSAGHAGIALGRAASCDLCHRSHQRAAGRSGSYTLKTDEQGALPAGWLAADAPGAGAITASCLRCHWTESVRRRQPEGNWLPAGPGRYLGPELSDDHPLGDVWERGPRALPAAPPGSPPPAPPAAAVAGPGRPIECTTCHDPHDAAMGRPDRARQLQQCGTCHGPQLGTLGAHGGLACTDCHLVHGAPQPDLLGEPTRALLCTRCHAADAGLAGRAPWSNPLAIARAVPSGPPHQPGSACDGCHLIH